MHVKRELLLGAFNLFLDRYVPPKHLQANLEAMQAEADSLFKMIHENAPQIDFEPWLKLVIKYLEVNMETRAWPTVSEVAKAVQATSKQTYITAPSAVEAAIDPTRIIVQNIKSGRAVGEGHLYGRLPAEMLSRGQITEKDLDRYRIMLHEKKTRIWGEAAANKAKQENEARHEAAMKMGADTKRERRHLELPIKRMTGEKGETGYET